LSETPFGALRAQARLMSNKGEQMTTQTISEGTSVTFEAWVVVTKGTGDEWTAEVLLNDSDPPVSILGPGGESTDESIAATATIVTDSFMKNAYTLF
jgi:hypothetical protein